ncbi:MAG: UbiA family prenyltransferase [Paraglaciecola sp.]|nr:UbiA family prenyltransferase [Paraglaciecola sp.]
MNYTTLYVDLDGTFFKTDLLFESIIVLLKANPLNIFSCLFWLLKGKAYLKSQIAKRVTINFINTPVNREFFDFLTEQKKLGRQLILATASNELFAQQVCQQFDMFDRFIASDEQNNLSAKNKLRAIQLETPTFSYAGNSKDDLVLFEHAKEAYLVNASKSVTAKARKFNLNKEFDAQKTQIKSWFKQLRLYQWVKNSLIFVPLMVSGYFTDISLVWQTSLGFLSFGLLASSTYIINDLLDLEADRAHKSKCNRPLAASLISIPAAITAAVSLFSIAFVLAVFLTQAFVIVLLAYLILTLFYSFKLKQFIGIDVISLAALYTVRIIAGAAIIGVEVSFWLLAFSMLIFLSLALVKRCAELKGLELSGKSSTAGRDYTSSDYSILQSFGSSSSFLSVLIFCFYVNNNVISDQYQTPTVLWLILPALTYWLMRMWIKTNRGEMHDDPIVFSLKDKGSLITIGFMGMITLLAQIT